MATPALNKSWRPQKEEGGRGPDRLIFFLLLIILINFSCTSSVLLNKTERAILIKGIPFFPQEEYQCGPASLAGVLNFWGIKISPEDIAREIYSPAAKGTLNMDLFFYAQKKGLPAQQYQGSLEDIKKNISAGIPLIVQVDYGFLFYERIHFMVVVGYNNEGIIANSGLEKNKFILLSSFLKSWKKSNYWTLRIAPLERLRDE